VQTDALTFRALVVDLHGAVDEPGVTAGRAEIVDLNGAASRFATCQKRETRDRQE
jgi:hypothetical protein